MTVKAISKEVKLSPRKLSVVADLVRGQSVDNALTILEHTPRRGAKPIAKTIASARANADYNHNYKPDSLIITELTINHGQRAKRYRPAAHGRALPYQKRTSHITIVVDGEKRSSAKLSRKVQADKPKKPAAKALKTEAK